MATWYRDVMMWDGDLGGEGRLGFGIMGSYVSRHNRGW